MTCNTATAAAAFSASERLFAKLTSDPFNYRSTMPDKALRNLIQMMCARGYAKDIELYNLNILADGAPPEERKVDYMQRVILMHRSTASCTARSPTVAILPLCDQTGVDGKLSVDVVRIFDKMELPYFSDSIEPVPTPLNHFVIVHGNGNVTPVALQKIAAYNRKGGAREEQQQQQHAPPPLPLYIEMFQVRSLMYNPATRSRVELVDPEVNSIALNAAGSQSYAVMSFNDAQRLYYDWPEGTLVCCWRQRGSLCQDYIIRKVECRK